MEGDEGRPTGTSDAPTGTTGDEPAGGSGAPEGGSGTGDTNVEEQLETARQELENEKRKNAQLLSQKSNWERQAPAAGNPPPTPEPYAGSVLEEIQQDMATVQSAMRSPDPEVAAMARMQWRTLQRQEQRALELEHRIELSRVSDQEELDGVKQLMATGEFNTIAAARRAWKGDRLGARETEINQERDRLKAEAEARKAGVVSTATRPIGPGETRGRTITYSEYHAKMAELPIAEKRKLMDDEKAGRLKLVPD